MSISYITSFTCDTIGTYLRQIAHRLLVRACVHVGEWPLVINTRTAFTAGNHSVSITAADSNGLSAQNIVPFTLLDTTRTNRELMLIDYHCIMYLKIYFNTKISEELMCNYMPEVLLDKSKSVQHPIIRKLAPVDIAKIFE